MDPEMRIEYWPLSRLHPQPDNPRVNEHAVPKMAKIIARIGFRVPIIARSDGLICDGHLRWKAAKHLKLETVPVIVADDLEGDELLAFRLSVNRAAELAEWDEDLLAQDLGALSEAGQDLEKLGFDDKYLAKLLDEEDEKESPGVSDVSIQPSFWIAISGPLEAQAEALAALRDLAKVTGVEVQSNIKGEG